MAATPAAMMAVTPRCRRFDERDGADRRIVEEHMHRQVNTHRPKWSAIGLGALGARSTRYSLALLA